MTVATASPNILSERFKIIRKARKIGRGKLAKLSGLTERQITRIEQGDISANELSAEQLEQIACSLKISEQALLGGVPLEKGDLLPDAALQCHNSCCS